MDDKQKIGEVFNYFSNVGVAAIKLTDAGLAIGDTISIEGASTNFTQSVDSMQVDRNPVESAEAGQSVGIKVADKVRAGDIVYMVLG